jgi:hypothetical protein
MESSFLWSRLSLGGLIMNTLVLQATPMAQWHFLIEEAERACSIHLNADLESYLVFLLMRFSKQPDLAAKIFAFEFLEAVQAASGARRECLLQTVGDTCLLYSGLFPDQASKRHVKVSYFVDIGRSAYSTLAVQGHHKLAGLFDCLSQFFVAAMDILQTTRELSGNVLGLSPIQAEELWSDTGSQHARAILQRYMTRQQVPISGSFFEKSRKH